MNGLYALKPWYAGHLAGVRRSCVEAHVAPATLSLATAGLGVVAGLVLAAPPGPLAAAAVGVLLAGRLAATNLDGAVARESGCTTTRGALLGEATDRVADLAALAGLAWHLPLGVVAAVLLAASAPSWVSLAAAASGLGPRRQGGPVGKTERCLLLVVAALTGWWLPVALVVGVGSLLTAALRARAATR